MLKRLLVGGGIAGVLTIGVIIGSLTLGPVFAQTGNNDTGQGQATISAADAEAAALVANPGASIVETDLEKENGVLVYSVELSNGIDVAVDANSGEILQTAANDEDNRNESEDQDSAENESGTDVEEQNEVDEAAALQANATISATDAEVAALAANPGATVIETELENENGVLVYSVELSNGKDVKVDAGTAKVLHTEAGDQDSEDGEQETAED